MEIEKISNWEIMVKYTDQLEKKWHEHPYRMACVAAELQSTICDILNTLQPDALQKVLSNGVLGEFYKNLNTEVRI